MSATAQTTRIPTGTWNLDPVHSSIGFAVSYAGVGTFRGTFADFDAKLVDGRLEGVAKVGSVKVDDENLTGHLQSPDFFDAEQHSELRFVSKSLIVRPRGRNTSASSSRRRTLCARISRANVSISTGRSFIT